MRCQSPAAINNFSYFISQAESECVEQYGMTIEKKLSVIKRCIAEKEFSKNVEIGSKSSKQINDTELQNLNNYEIEINNFEALKIINKIRNAILNKAASNISINELNILSNFVNRLNEVLTSDEFQESLVKQNTNSKPSFLNSLSLFSEMENKISKKDESKYNKRKIKKSVPTNKLIGSLSISSTDDESIKIHFRLK